MRPNGSVEARAKAPAGPIAVDNKRVRNASVSKGSSSRARTFGQTLRDTRRQARVSQDDLAQRSGVDRSAISNYERGRREPNLRTIVKLARALDVEPASLLRDL
jgi:DNA-binding XRE family transcriptional regulator